MVGNNYRVHMLEVGWRCVRANGRWTSVSRVGVADTRHVHQPASTWSVRRLPWWVGIAAHTSSMDRRVVSELALLVISRHG